ncbi:MAG: prolipoprotein diacylglyceryl transferase [Pseudomonadota bacterium]
MRPILFQIGPLEVPAFFFMIMLAVLSATFYAQWLAKREGADPVVLLDFGILAIIASVLGSRIFHILIENPAYYWEKPIRVFYFWQGGFVSIGAYVFTIIAMLIYIRWRHLDSLRYFDISATAIPLAIFFVRVGCLAAGCCYGKPTDFCIHLTFNDPGTAAGYYHLGEPLHATQLYNMINALIMGGVLYLVYKHRKFKGQVLATFFIYYGVTRFMIEFLRGDEDRGLFFGDLLSTGQIAMLVSIGVGIFLYIWLSKKGARGCHPDHL